MLRDARVSALPRTLAVATARRIIAGLRAAIARDELSAIPDVAARVATDVEALLRGQLRPVLNATGIVVHTNLGRAPWAQEAIAAAARVAASGCNLEIDLATGKRGGRSAGVEALLCALTGAEAAMVVNNASAAVLLALTSLARDRSVLVSRGESVEIGGGFRIPDVITACGARLVEVGTTNRTRARDFAAALSPDVAVLLRVHSSNFRVIGFTEAPSRAEVVALARGHGVVVVEDAGSGSLDERDGEPGIRDAVAAGVDVVLFSGDKLLGGPQAGIAVGKREVVERLRTHPLYRALRVDKVTLAALEATLALHATGRWTPVGRMLHEGIETVLARAERLAAALAARGVPAEVGRADAFAGGGSLPEQALPSAAVVVRGPRPDVLSQRLRTGEPAVLARVADGAVWLDARTLRDEDIEPVALRVASARSDG